MGLECGSYAGLLGVYTGLEGGYIGLEGVYIALEGLPGRLVGVRTGLPALCASLAVVYMELRCRSCAGLVKVYIGLQGGYVGLEIAPCTGLGYKELGDPSAAPLTGRFGVR